MTLFAVLFTDRPGHSELRATHLQAHIDWVDAHKDQVLVAGSLRHEPGDVPKGGLWIVESESKDAVFALIQSDPFTTCGMRQGVEVFHWNKALQHHKALV